MSTRPKPSNARLADAKFVISLPKWKKGAIPPHPEICFAGRSNVGKSSLINVLTGRKNLARTSSTPGRTQSLVVFESRIIAPGQDMKIHLVDLPGYGWAKVPLSLKKAWAPMVQGYLRNNPLLRCCILLLDLRREPRQEDFDLLELAGEAGFPVLPVVTKVDKAGKTQRTKELQRIADALELDSWQDLWPVSSATREGLGELLEQLAELVRDEDEEEAVPEEDEV